MGPFHNTWVPSVIFGYFDDILVFHYYFGPLINSEVSWQEECCDLLHLEIPAAAMKFGGGSPTSETLNFMEDN